jgi:hypothetical protein
MSEYSRPPGAARRRRRKPTPSPARTPVESPTLTIDPDTYIPTAFVDIKRIPELASFSIDAHGLLLGAESPRVAFFAEVGP